MHHTVLDIGEVFFNFIMHTLRYAVRIIKAQISVCRYFYICIYLRSEFCQALDKAFKAEGPVWIDCRIVQNEKVLPMIPNGMTVDDSIFE